MSLFDDLEDQAYVKAKEELKNDLLIIEEKNIDWFKARAPVFSDDMHDRLHNHYNIHKTQNTILLFFDEDTPLPKHIIDECRAAYKKRFGQGQD